MYLCTADRYDGTSPQRHARSSSRCIEVMEMTQLQGRQKRYLEVQMLLMPACAETCSAAQQANMDIRSGLGLDEPRRALHGACWPATPSLDLYLMHLDPGYLKNAVDVETTWER